MNQGIGKLFFITTNSSPISYFQATKAPLTIETNFLEGKDILDTLQSFDPNRAFQILNQKLSEITIDHQAMRIQLYKLSRSEPLKKVAKARPEGLERSLQDSK